MGNLVGLIRVGFVPVIKAVIDFVDGVYPLNAYIFKGDESKQDIEELASNCAKKMGIKKPIHFSYNSMRDSLNAVQAQGSSLFTKKIYLCINTRQLTNDTLELEMYRELARIKTNEKLVKPVIQFIAAGVTVVALGLLCPSWLKYKNVSLNPITYIAGLVGILATNVFFRWSNEYSFRVAVQHCSKEGRNKALKALKLEREMIINSMNNPQKKEGTSFITKIEKYFQTKKGDFIFIGLLTISRSRKIELLEKSLGVGSKVSQE